jgi:hypothetical protein
MPLKKHLPSDRPAMSFSGCLCNGHPLHAHLGGPLSQGAQHPLAVALIVVVLPLVGVLLALSEHGVGQARKFVRCGGDRFGFVPA